MKLTIRLIVVYTSFNENPELIIHYEFVLCAL